MRKDGTYDIDYDDGDKEKSVDVSLIKRAEEEEEEEEGEEGGKGPQQPLTHHCRNRGHRARTYMKLHKILFQILQYERNYSAAFVTRTTNSPALCPYTSGGCAGEEGAG